MALAEIAQIRELLSQEDLTEAQTIASIDRTSKLLIKHYADYSDIEINAGAITREAFDRFEAYELSLVDHLVPSIERFCGVKTWLALRYESDRYGNETSLRLLAIFGFAQDVQIAFSLYQMLGFCIIKETDEFIEKHLFQLGNNKASAIKKFQTSLFSRLKNKLTPLDIKTADGTALSALRSALVDAAFAKLKIKISRKQPITPTTNVDLTVSTSNG